MVWSVCADVCTCISEIPLDWFIIKFSFSQSGFHFFSYELRVSASREGQATPAGEPVGVNCTVQSVHVDMKCVYVTAFLVYG